MWCGIHGGCGGGGEGGQTLSVEMSDRHVENRMKDCGGWGWGADMYVEADQDGRCVWDGTVYMDVW